jgi:hypothetical protein
VNTGDRFPVSSHAGKGIVHRNIGNDIRVRFPDFLRRINDRHKRRRMGFPNPSANGIP